MYSEMGTESEATAFMRTRLPEHCVSGLAAYIFRGKRPGHFLCAVLANDLKESYARADETNLPRLRDYVSFLYNYAPGDSWGSQERIAAWVERGGLVGISQPVER